MVLLSEERRLFWHYSNKTISVNPYSPHNLFLRQPEPFQAKLTVSSSFLFYLLPLNLIFVSKVVCCLTLVPRDSFYSFYSVELKCCECVSLVLNNKTFFEWFTLFDSRKETKNERASRDVHHVLLTSFCSLLQPTHISLPCKGTKGNRNTQPASVI